MSATRRACEHDFRAGLDACPGLPTRLHAVSPGRVFAASRAISLTPSGVPDAPPPVYGSITVAGGGRAGRTSDFLAPPAGRPNGRRRPAKTPLAFFFFFLQHETTDDVPSVRKEYRVSCRIIFVPYRAKRVGIV